MASRRRCNTSALLVFTMLNTKMNSHLPSVLYGMAHSLSGVHCSGQCHTNWVLATEAETTHSPLVLSSSSGMPGTSHPVTPHQTCPLWRYVLFCSSTPPGTERRENENPLNIVHQLQQTFEVGHPCKSATCNSWPHFYRTSKCLWYYTWSLLL